MPVVGGVRPLDIGLHPQSPTKSQRERLRREFRGYSLSLPLDAAPTKEQEQWLLLHRTRKSRSQVSTKEESYEIMRFKMQLRTFQRKGLELRYERTIKRYRASIREMDIRDTEGSWSSNAHARERNKRLERESTRARGSQERSKVGCG